MTLSFKGVIIQKTVENDLPQIYSLLTEYIQTDKLLFQITAENLANHFASEDSILISALRKKKLLGFIIGSTESETAKIECLIVNKKFRNAGIGNAMLKIFIEDAAEKGCDNISVTAISNSESINFFSNHGFTPDKTYVELYKKNNIPE